MNNNLEKEKIIFYDGDCVFCNKTVQWIIKHDKNNRFKFSPQNSEFAKNFLKPVREKFNYLDSIIYYSDGKFYVEFEATIEILSEIYIFFKTIKKIFKFKIFIVIGNFFYRIIAKYRKKFLNNHCIIISGVNNEFKDKFIY
ncbi:MAG: thiol-disulfide oxidoreductase [Leptospiraceae bacterium]|nr:MAG: thiol-disulfide oxidoreductase [Leptospiraceae bacterium]